MLSLLSRIVSGGESEEQRGEREREEREREQGEREERERDNVFHRPSPSSSSSLSSSNGDTDEELITSLSPPIINIDQTEVGEDALALEGEKKRKDQEKEEEEELEEELEEEEGRRVVELVEYYLSDEHLVKDMFLLKHVTRHREGYISIKLLAAYKKVKRVSRGWRGVASALRTSEALEISPDGTKVRRKSPLPPHLHNDTRPFRTVLAAGLEPDKASMGIMAELFARFGEVTALQLHRPGGGRCITEVRQAEKQTPGLSSEVCVLVEYEKVHHARHAVKHLVNTQELGLRPVPLPRSSPSPPSSSCPSSRRSSRPDTLNIATTEGESAYYSTSDFSEPTSPISRGQKPHRISFPHSPYSSMASSTAPSPLGPRRRPRVPQSHQSSPESSPPSPYTPRRGAPTPSSSPESLPRLEPRCCLHPPGSSPLPRRNLPRPRDPRDTPSPRPRDSPLPRRHTTDSPLPRRPAGTDSPLPRRPAGTEGGHMGSLSPWLRRRVVSGGSARSSPSASPVPRRRPDNTPMTPDNVTRFPRGPDGTRGFTQRRLTAPAHA